jgi:RHS repeat-associated protein
VTNINSYDDYGIPAAGNVGRFGYTGQAWLPELGFYNYKARMYSPTLGRFLQTDPIGYADGLNWYNYVGGDPINNIDPSGLEGEDIIVTGNRAGRVSIPNTALSGSVSYNQISGGRSPGDTSGAEDSEDKQKMEKQDVQCPAVHLGNVGTRSATQVNMSRPGWQIIYAAASGYQSLQEAQSRFPNSIHNGPGHAWRHFRWSFSMTRWINSRAAADFANSHEVSNPNPVGETRMDSESDS